MPTDPPPDPSRQHRRTERDYVLGTHDAEVERLGFQHDVWRQEVLRAWSAAGITAGSKVIDIGAGPGFATLDLADIVGPAGRVVAVERSGRFLGLLGEEVARRGLRSVELVELDLMHDHLPASGFDAAWCRWVACFVPDPQLLVTRMAEALRPGGRAVFHEYSEYATYRLLPPPPGSRCAVEGFVQAVFESWRAQGGEPDIARALPRLLAEAGLELASVRPIARCARPGETLWNWPAGFVRTNVPRLVEIGMRDASWGAAVLARLEAAERDPASVFVTPTVLEIIATKR